MTHLSTRGANMDGLRWLDAIGRTPDLACGCSSSIGDDPGRCVCDGGGDCRRRDDVRGMSEMLDPSLPFPGGDRVVALNFVGPNHGHPERQVIHEFAALRGQLVTVEHFGAFRDAGHNLVACGDRARTGDGCRDHGLGVCDRRHAGIAAGAICCPPTRPASAPPVVVIGHDAWQLRFGADPNGHGTHDQPRRRVRGRSSASCRKRSSSRSITSSGFPCAIIR